MKMENKEQDSPQQLSSMKKGRVRKRVKKKPRSALQSASELSGAHDPPPSPAAVVTSRSEDVTSEVTACETCEIQTRNPAQLAAHLNSNRHARRRHELRILAALPGTVEVTAEVDRQALAARLARGNAGLDVPAARLSDDSLPDCIAKNRHGKIGQKVSYSCGTCSVQLTSLVKVQEHLASRRHVALQAGRPPPPRMDRPSARKTKKKSAAVKQSWFW